MNKAARATLVVAALSVSGGILAMNLMPASSGAKTVAAPVSSQTIVTAADLGANVNWAKVKQAPATPSF
jgi:hypothetical protein